MCIAILRPAGTRLLTLEEFTNSWNRNSDGFGCMFQIKEKGVLKVKFYKTMNRQEALDFFNNVQESTEVLDIAFHFRIATHGTVGVNNCHPFSAGNGFMIMHNGMLRLSDPFGEKSDTAILADTLSRITEKWWENENRIKELEKFATGSKLIFMDKNQSFIVNENGVSAHWADDIWFSNRSYESYVYTQPKTTYVPPTYVVSDDYYEKRHKKGKGKYKGGYLHPSLVPQQPTPEQLSKIVEIQEWTTYKSSIQGCLDSEKRKNLNEMGMDETNWLWCLFADGQTLTLEEKKANIKEFYDFVMTKSFIQSK